MSESVAAIFEKGYEQYQAGETPENLIPLFQEVCDRAPKNAAGWSSLAWLYLLTDQKAKALKAAQKAVKLDPRAPQARINLSLAILDMGKAGVREHIEVVQQIMLLDGQIGKDIRDNIEDGLKRKPDWQSLQKIKNWLLPA
jgi:predicted Zn-dependent protease